MAKIDVRNNLNVTELSFSDTYSITGDIGSDLISIKTVGIGTDRVICTKTEVDDLIKALQISKRVW